MFLPIQFFVLVSTSIMHQISNAQHSHLTTLCPDFQGGIPWPCTKCISFGVYTNARHMLIMRLIKGKGWGCLVTKSVPCQHIWIGMASKQNSTTSTEGYWCQSLPICLDFAKFANFIVRPQVEDPCCTIFWSSSKSKSIAHKVYTIDVAFMASKGLDGTFWCANVPNLGCSVNRGRDKHIRILGVDGQCDDIFLVLCKDFDGSLCRNIPQDNHWISRPRQNLLFIQEPTRCQESIMWGQLHCRLFWITLIQVVNGAQIVQSSRGDHLSLGGLHGNTHDVGRFQRNDM